MRFCRFRKQDSIVILWQNLAKPATVLRQILITYICRNQRYWHKLNWIECKSGHCDLQVVHIHWYLKIELFLYHIIGRKKKIFSLRNTTAQWVQNLSVVLLYLWFFNFPRKFRNIQFFRWANHRYRTSSYSFCGNYSFFNLEFGANSNSCHNI